MSATPVIARPIRCSQCQGLMDSPLCCSTCGALGQIPPDSLNCFDLFGLSPSYDIDVQQLHRKYLVLSRAIHPDLCSTAAPEQRQKALMLSAELNRAYETLRDPVSRAEYLLSLHGGPTSAEDRSVPPDLLGQVLMIRDEIEEATAAGDYRGLAAIRDRVDRERERSLAAVATLARGISADQESLRRQLRQHLNCMRYWNNLLEQLPINSGCGTAGVPCAECPQRPAGPASPAADGVGKAE